MKLRFFAVLLVILFASTLAVVYVHIRFFRDEPLALLDSQLRSVGTKLASVDLSRADSMGHVQLNRLISQTLGNARISKIFRIVDGGGRVIFRSADVPLLDRDFPRTPQVTAIADNEIYVRIYNLRLQSHPGWVLQSMAVLDPTLLDWNVIDPRVMVSLISVVGLIFIVSLGLSFLLYAPVRTLSHHLTAATSDLKGLREIEPLPVELQKLSKSLVSRFDDLGGLIGVVQKMIDRINSNYRLTRAWSFQMAHELKTPLTLMRAQIEAKVRGQWLSEAEAAPLLKNVDHISGVITQFLNWADLENSGAPKDIHAVRLQTVASQTKLKLDYLFPHRLHLQFHEDLVVLADPLHIEQMVSNLVLNSLKYSPQDRPVEIHLDGGRLRVVDFGAGIPQDVMDRVGQPFNVGANPFQTELKGHGLGLAWVTSLARVYDWDLRIHTSSTGTEISVRFPPQV